MGSPLPALPCLHPFLPGTGDPGREAAKEKIVIPVRTKAVTLEGKAGVRSYREYLRQPPARSPVRPDCQLVSAGIGKMKPLPPGEREDLFCDPSARRNHATMGPWKIRAVDHDQGHPGAVGGIGIEPASGAAARRIDVIVPPVPELPAKNAGIELFCRSNCPGVRRGKFDKIDRVRSLSQEDSP